ncbi:glutathione-regulated potassium-efflux system protein KefC [Kaarinaea lacus]
MDDHDVLINALIYLGAAVLAVPFAKRLGLGSVLGYLIAGIVIGPWGLRLITNVKDIFHFAEFGVVLLLFIIGLELNPARLWSMRKPLLGLGGAQVIITGIFIYGIAIFIGVEWKTALVAAMGLSLSSTAIALQILSEKNLIRTPAGSAGFSVLLFQDVAVIPMLALIPFMQASQVSGDSGNLMAFVKVVAVILAIIVGGHYIVRHVLRVIANTRLPEIFTAFSLLLVIGIALLMQTVDMSMALGAFLAGVLLADSEYRHQLESEIEPFKGLLMGLFFIAVGMSIDFGILLKQPLLVLSLVVALVAIKLVILMLLGKVFSIPLSQNYLFGFLLCQGGEFAFVLFGVASNFNVVQPEVVAVLTVVVAISMMCTPLLMILDEKWIEPRFALPRDEVMEEVKIDEENAVIIAGFGRFGQIVARLLHANNINTTVIDHSPENIERVRKFGYKVFYGDVSRLDLLRSAGAEKAKLLILAIDDRNAMLKTIEEVKKHFPHLQIQARAWDMVHAYELLDHGVQIFERETFESALLLGERALQSMGYGAYRAKRAAQRFKIHDIATFHRLYEVHKDEETWISMSQEAREELEKLFVADEEEIETEEDGSWG